MFLNSEFFADFCWNGVLVDEEVHRVGGDESFCHIPGALVLAGLTPGVLHHVILLAVLILGHSIDEHAMVVGEFPVVETLLAQFLGSYDLGNSATQ